MNNDENNSENNSNRLINIIHSASQLIITQRNMIKSLTDTNKILEQIIELKDSTLDKQLQMLQLMELKLKEFGYELGETSIF